MKKQQDLHRRNPGHRCDGFGLVEAMVGIMVLVICVGGLAWMVVAAKSSSDQARDHYIAVNLAKNRIERGKTLDWDSLDMFESDEVVVDENGSADSEGNFQLTTAVTTVSTNLKEMAVTVGIRNRRTRGFDGEQEALSTYFADYEDAVAE